MQSWQSAYMGQARTLGPEPAHVNTVYVYGRRPLKRSFHRRLVTMFPRKSAWNQFEFIKTKYVIFEVGLYGIL
jgi:hypothetical protein